jgi:1-acyl-sn-glycerol-3-phosphate acyltransferase
MINPVVAVMRFIAFVSITLGMLPFYLAALAVRWKRHSLCARAYWRAVAKALGLRVVTRGTPVTGGPTLFVANHASYLDIVVLGSQIPGCFVAKTEVGQWPALGPLSRMARTVFIDRSRGAARKERDQMRLRLEAGEQLILFPEGTSNDGNSVLPFKSSLFAVAEQPIADAKGDVRPLTVQPVSLAYSRLDGMPMQRAFRPFFAWYGDMTLVGHLYQVLGLGNVTIDVIYHPPVTIDDFADRKALAHHCHDVIRHTVVLALAGRLPQPA